MPKNDRPAKRWNQCSISRTRDWNRVGLYERWPVMHRIVEKFIGRGPQG
jgi:hypothetical protein